MGALWDYLLAVDSICDVPNRYPCVDARESIVAPYSRSAPLVDHGRRPQKKTDLWVSPEDSKHSLVRRTQEFRVILGSGY